jgi:DNA-directed RNA polymerase subunit beta
VKSTDVHFIDVSTTQAFSVATSMIPFLNHDDANRALMGSNMQKQATPCVLPEAPLVATGIEEQAAAEDSGRIVHRRRGRCGDRRRCPPRGRQIQQGPARSKSYKLVTFSRTNGFTAFHQRPTVSVGDKVKKGTLLVDTSSTDGGQMALGQNIFVAFMSWGGVNYEDAIIVSERLVQNSKFTSIHVEEFVVNVRDTKLGPEVTTHDIPNVGENKLKNLDEDGVIRIGAEVRPGDILVGKITPKGESQLTPEERLLRSLFGEKARDVKDTSKRMENGKRGRVIGVKVFSREKGDKLDSGIIKRIHIEIAQLRNVSVGDKLAGRHGNKGVISRVLPVEDMPYTADGTPIDMILTPLGVPSRMNLGQILELHLGLAANTLGYQAIVPPFVGATDDEIKQELESWLPGERQDSALRWPHGRDLQPGHRRRLHVHSETPPHGGGQDSHALHRSVLAHHSAAAWAARRRAVVSASEKWKCGHSSVTVWRTRCEKCSRLSPTTSSAAHRPSTTSSAVGACANRTCLPHSTSSSTRCAASRSTLRFSKMAYPFRPRLA